MNLEDRLINRRTVVAGVGVAAAATALAACSTYGKDSSSSSQATKAPAASDGGSAQAGASGAAIAKTSDVPVGGGIIVGDTVVTQPSAGTFVGLSSVCTHAGCAVSEVTNGTIDCPCHGSKFNLDGTVANGPARTPLESKPVTVQGDSIVAS